MSHRGVEIAEQQGQYLPSFSSLEEARSFLFHERDTRLATLRTLAARSKGFAADDTSGSLKQLEEWYNQLVETDGFPSLGVTRSDFEGMMASYFCHVAVTNCPNAKWRIQEYPFVKGKYEIGVELLAMRYMVHSFRDRYLKAKARSLLKEYQHYFHPRS